MYDTETRVRMARLRAQAKRRQWEKRAINALSILNIALFCCLAFAFVYLAGGQDGAVQGMNGATLLPGGAGGYVLVGVIAFTAAVVITVLCIRLREKNNPHDPKNKEENER